MKCLVGAIATLILLFVGGCQQSASIGNKPGDEFNGAMSEKQKALNAEHKNRAVN